MYIGNYTSQDCVDYPVEGVLKVLNDSDRICEKKFSKDLNGSVVVVNKIDQFLSPVTSGCSVEESLRILESVGVVGFLSYSEKIIPGNTVYYHSMGETKNTGKIYAISVGYDFEKVLDQLYTASETIMRVQIASCNVSETYIQLEKKILPAMFIFFGLISLLFSIIGFSKYWALVKSADNIYLRSERKLIVMIESCSLFIISLLLILGLTGPWTYSAIGNDYFGHQVKFYFLTLFSGVNLFSTVLAALFWRQLVKAVKAVDKIRQGMMHSKINRLIIFLSFVYCIGGEHYANFERANFRYTNYYILVFGISAGNFCIAIFFSLQVRAMVKHMARVAHMEQSFRINNCDSWIEEQEIHNSSRPTKLFKVIREIGNYLTIYSTFVIIQTLSLMLIQGLRLSQSITGTVTFILISIISRIGMSAIKIWSFKVKKHS